MITNIENDLNYCENFEGVLSFTYLHIFFNSQLCVLNFMPKMHMEFFFCQIRIILHFVENVEKTDESVTKEEVVEEVADKVEEVVEKVEELKIEVVDKVEEVVVKADEVVEKVEPVVDKVEPVVDKVEEVSPVEPKLEGKLDQKTSFSFCKSVINHYGS